MTARPRGPYDAGMSAPSRRPFPRLLTALLALALCPPALAVETQGGVALLEWHDGTPDDSAAPLAHDDVWQRIRDGFRIDDTATPNPLLPEHQAWFAARPQNVERLAERARPYLYHIVEEIERRGMPMELALLPMIESAFVPTALSRSAASGIWQFIPSTGRHYGLRQDHWYDGRRDFTAATNAALDYLGKLFLDFGDWQLALAAYNCGEGCVARAIQKNAQLGLPTDYPSLSLPEETRNYVPKLLALRNLMRDPAVHAIAIQPLPNQPYFSAVTVHASLDLHSAARLADMSSEEFYALNAAFPRKIIRSDTPVNLLVPVDKADTFQRNLEAGQWDSWQPYQAKKGERPEEIAQRFGISVERLLEHNPVQLKRGKLKQAQAILVPVRRQAASKPAPGAAQAHIVARGETLFGIARRHGLTVDQLAAANPGLDSATLRPGQTLRLAPEPPASPLRLASLRVSAAPTAEPVPYTVARGDTLFGIARRHQVSVADLQAWNPELAGATLRPGQTLIVAQP